MTFSSDSPATVIVGAGMSGLTAASELARAGRRCLLLESQDGIGGLSRTYTIDEIPFDLGPHVFFNDPDSEVGAFTNRLIAGEPMLRRPYRFGIEAKGRYWSFPLSAPELLRYPWRYKRQILWNRLVKQRQAGLHPESLASFMTGKSGTACYDDVFSHLIYKKTLLPGSHLHFHWWLRVDRTADNRLEPPPANVLKRGRFFERMARKLAPWYIYPKDGFERLPQLLWERYRQAGGETILNCGPVTLDTDGQTVKSVTVQGNTMPVREVIWTGNINSLNSLLGAAAPKLDYVDMAIICLTYNQQRQAHRPFIYTYHTDPEYVFNRIYYPSNIYGHALPDGREGLCLELNLGEDIKGSSPDELIKLAVANIEKMGLHPGKSLRESRIFMIKDALPVYGLDYQAKMEEAYRSVRVHKNLLAVGRQGGYFFCLSPAAVGQGLKAAKAILASGQPAASV